MKLSRPVQLLLGGAISGAGLWIFLRDVDLRQLGDQLAQSDPLVVVATPVIMVLALWLRAIRWRLMLPDTPDTHTRGLMGVVSIGFMVNNMLPARIGEAVRAVLLWKRNGYSIATSVGSLILERVIDLVVYLILFSVPLLATGAAPSLRPYAIGMAAMAGTAILCFAVYAALPAASAVLARRLAGLLPGKVGTFANKTLEELLCTLEWARSWRTALPVILLSFVTILCYPATVYLLGLQGGELSVLHSLVAASFAAFGAAIPLSPGYVGTLHAAMLQGLVVLGYPKEAGRALVILYHALGYIATTGAGLWYFVRLDLRFKDIAKARENLE